jgi:predicted nucleic acid-binding protein
VAALVLDASVALSAVLGEANSELARQLLIRVAETGAVVPNLWHLEVGQTFLVAARLGRLDRSHRLSAAEQFVELPIEVDQATATYAWREIMIVAEQYRLSLYDAAYLELSMRRSLPLATFDAALRRGATAAGVPVL